MTTRPVALDDSVGLVTISNTANGVLIGNGIGAPTTVAPGSSGNVLQSNGTTWSSQPSTSGTQRTFGFFAG